MLYCLNAILSLENEADESFERFTMSHMIRQNNYNLKHNAYFVISNAESVFHGTKRLSYLGPRIWNLVPDKLKQLSNLYEIKNWMPKKLPM